MWSRQSLFSAQKKIVVLSHQRSENEVTKSEEWGNSLPSFNYFKIGVIAQEKNPNVPKLAFC